MDKETFIEKSIHIFNEQLDYSKVEYKNTKAKITLLCKVHNQWFEQKPEKHLNGQRGCSYCNGKKKNRKKLINKLSKLHNNKYDYSLLNENDRYFIIICPTHGKFEQYSFSHISGKGCEKCYKDSIVKDTTSMIKRFKEVHNKYNYSNSKYINANTKVEIICPTHGSFYQVPYNHYSGKGCKKCNISKGEAHIINILKKYNIAFEPQKTFDTLVSNNNRLLKFDFFLPNYNIIIEYNGKQHYESVKFFGGDIKFKSLKNNDKLKGLYCINNNIDLIIFKYDMPFNKVEEKIKTVLDV